MSESADFNSSNSTNQHDLQTESLTKLWNKKISPTGNLLHVNEFGNLDVSSTSLADVSGIHVQTDAIHNKNYGAIRPWMTGNVDKVGQILISDTHCNISLSANTVGELVIRTPTYTAGKCLISVQDGLVAASTVTSDEVKYLTGVNTNIKERLDELAALHTGLNLNYSQFREVLTSK